MKCMGFIITLTPTAVGEALCFELSKHGALLIMSARSEKKMESIRQALENPGNTK